MLENLFIREQKDVFTTSLIHKQRWFCGSVVTGPRAEASLLLELKKEDAVVYLHRAHRSNNLKALFKTTPACGWRPFNQVHERNCQQLQNQMDPNRLRDNHETRRWGRQSASQIAWPDEYLSWSHLCLFTPRANDVSLNVISPRVVWDALFVVARDGDRGQSAICRVQNRIHDSLHVRVCLSPRHGAGDNETPACFIGLLRCRPPPTD